MRFFKLMIGKISGLLFLALLFLLCAQTNQAQADIKVSGDITTDTVWEGTERYVVTGTVHIRNNATLTIVPGVEVYLNSSARINIGYSSTSTGTLNAQGTENNPITFTGSSDDPWNYLQFVKYTAEKGSILSHCLIENGGNSCIGMVVVETSNLTIEHCTFKNSANSGLYLGSDGVPTLNENSYENNANYPIYISSAVSLSAIDSASSYTNNNDNRIYVSAPLQVHTRYPDRYNLDH